MWVKPHGGFRRLCTHITHTNHQTQTGTHIMSLKGLLSDSESSISHTSDEGGRKSDKRKQSLYFPADVVKEMETEAKRLDRSLSWVVQRAWKLAKEEVRSLPTVNDVDAAAE